MTKIEGLDQHEIVALAALAENLEHPEDYATSYQIKRDMERSGFTKVAITLALKSVVQKELVTYSRFSDEDGQPYVGYNFTDRGWEWVLSNRDKFLLSYPPEKINEDDIPF